MAVDCDPDVGDDLVTVVGEGLAPGVYVGEFDPSTGVDVTLDASSGASRSGRRR